ncbi:T9SS type A sorting domain-containing protein [Hymenobacter sp. HDW8]|uniref:T9SS type A sorting domain-containing protein n=1 Tax=Hymenobacter sp. HDW8 TaxID=2714932 RepID=UPI0014093B12|nr:T9SS type A sorting domain-containing protein [Hymenobacter sp. HDW8]QIL77528.1 T9SS type A sorting domain-containing protein [Hymenobacter sp. HDW8]
MVANQFPPLLRYTQPWFAYWAFFLVLILRATTAQAQTPTWQMAMAVSQAASSITSIRATATDANGNVFLVGNLYGTATFGGTTLTSAGNNDIFVAKWSSATKSFVWAQRAGGAGFGSDYATAIAVNGSNIYIAGAFQSPTVDFGSITLANFDNSTNTADIVVAKLVDAGSSGSFVWAQRAGGVGADEAKTLAINGTSIYVGGFFSSPTVSFGSLSLTHANAGTKDMFVVKLRDEGSSSSFVWAQQAGGGGEDIAEGLAVSGQSVYAVGSYTSAVAQFDGTSLTNTVANTSISADGFVVKITDAGTAGSFAWALRCGGDRLDYANSIAASGTSVYVGGFFSSPTVGFGSLSLTNVSAGTYDIFVAKVTDTGSAASFIWAQQAGGIKNEYPSSLAVNGRNIYIAGYFLSATAAFGSTSVTNLDNSTNTADIVVAKLTDAGPSGSFVWSQQAGGSDSDMGWGLAVDAQGMNVYVVGSVVGTTAKFGSQPIAAADSRNQVAYVASLSDNTILGSSSPGQLAGVSVYPNPAHNTATIRLPLTRYSARVRFTIIDGLGRVVQTCWAASQANNLDYPLDLTDLSPGLYALWVQAGAESSVLRLVID